jgi:predicted trehalose synthase
MRKSITAAHKAYDGHVKALEGVAGKLEELADSGEGKEADHGSMSVGCKEAFAKAVESHGNLGEAIKSMHKAITNEDDDEGKPADENGDGSAPLPEDDDSQKSLIEGFTKALEAA